MDWLRLGDFELSPSERQLRLAGKPVELGARAFDLLLVLAEQPGRLVAKNTLIERVWPRLVVDENNLPAQIASLRRALGAGAIRTVPGYGYRLELPVSAGDAEPAPVKAAPQDAVDAPSLPARRPRPEPLDPLLGREHELAELEQALRTARLVTVVGVAGVGKTRLAHEVLASCAEDEAGAAWVSLRQCSETTQVPAAIALALGFALPAQQDGFVALAQAIDRAPLLLVLDGAEHLGAEIGRPLAAMLRQTASLRVLVTSQVPLGLAGEQVYRLAALALPVPGEALPLAAERAAVRFFCQRAGEADRHFTLGNGNTATVVEICRRLDGIPLALELAAARVPALGVAALLEHLDDRFRLLKHANRTDDPRHDTLRSAFDWSHGLLSAREQRVFDSLGIFAGSFSLQIAARCVADDDIDQFDAIDLIGRLVDRSLVSALPLDPPRYALLETARCYARARLVATGREQLAQRRHALAMLHLLDAAYEEYWALDEALFLGRCEGDIDNVRAALEWAAGNDAALAVALYGSAWPLFVEADLESEARARFEQVVGRLSDSLPRARIGRFWEAVATLESMRGWDRARYAADLAAVMHERANDVRARYYALELLALNWRGDHEAARAAHAQAQSLEDPAWPARLLAFGASTEGALATAEGDFARARSAYARSLRHALSAGERHALAATVRIVELDIASGDVAGALHLVRPLAFSLRNAGRREARFELLVLYFSALLLAGEIDEARGMGADLYALARRLDSSKLHSALDAMAYLACVDGRAHDAARIAACADQAQLAHGKVARGPVEQLLRAALGAMLERNIGRGWMEAAQGERALLDEAGACRLALGLV